MNGNASISGFIYIRIGSTVCEALTSYDTDNWFEPINRKGFSAFSFVSVIFYMRTDWSI